MPNIESGSHFLDTTLRGPMIACCSVEASHRWLELVLRSGPSYKATLLITKSQTPLDHDTLVLRWSRMPLVRLVVYPAIYGRCMFDYLIPLLRWLYLLLAVCGLVQSR
jgi:hypothetical protein